MRFTWVMMVYLGVKLDFKISNTSVLFSNKMLGWLSGFEFTKWLSELQTGKTLIRLLLQKQSEQSDLRLSCLSTWLSVQNFRAFT